LTNYLKELVSFRHWNMMDESHIINIIKVGVCEWVVRLDMWMYARLSNYSLCLHELNGV